MLEWNFDPEIVQFGPIRIRWYGLMFLLGFSIGYMIIKKVCRLESKSFNDLEKILNYIVVGTVVGARLGHCLFYDPGYYLANPVQILKVWEGGLASHGGAAGVLFSIWLFSRKNPQFELLWLLDRISIPVGLVGSLIRVGNLFNSEILGLPTNVPWAVTFLRVDQIPRHPVQIYESFSYMLLFVFSYVLYLKNPKRSPGLFFGIMLFWIFSSRFVLEFFKTRQEAFEGLAFLNMGQWLSLPFAALGAVVIYRHFKTGKT